MAVLFLARPTSPWALMSGLLLVALGQALRFWAAGSVIRYRGEKVGAEKLVTWGPYALARNPLYMGNGLIGAGWGIMAGWKAFFLFVGAFILLYNLLIIPWEEGFLEGKFGAAYKDYQERTGRFFPARWDSSWLKGPFDRLILWKSERHSVYVTLAGTALLLLRVL